MYENQDEIDEINLQLKEIDKNLEIGGYRIIGNKAVSVSLSILEKGNKKIINELSKIGFRNVLRTKVENGGFHGYAETRYKGYTFKVKMEKDI